MTIRIKSQKDFLAGLVFILFGAAFIWVGRNYPMGTTRRMGPGFFPMALAIILVGLGGFITLRSLIGQVDRIGRLNLKGLALISLASLAFAVLITRAGLIPAVTATVLLSAAASTSFTIRTAALMAATLAALCSLVFVIGLGLPILLFSIGL